MIIANRCSESIRIRAVYMNTQKQKTTFDDSSF